MARWSETPLSRNDLLWQAKREGAVVSHPCAKNAQGWGTLSRNGAYRNHYRWATRQILWYRQHRTRPCKERKDGAPTVLEREGRTGKMGHPSFVRQECPTHTRATGVSVPHGRSGMLLRHENH